MTRQVTTPCHGFLNEQERCGARIWQPLCYTAATNSPHVFTLAYATFCDELSSQLIFWSHYISKRLPWWLSSKNPPANAGEVGSVPGSGRSPGEGDGHPLQYSCLGNPWDRGAWRATVLEGRKRVRHNLVTKLSKNIQNCKPDAALLCMCC